MSNLNKCIVLTHILRHFEEIFSLLSLELMMPRGAAKPSIKDEKIERIKNHDITLSSIEIPDF